jgi:hypothetical protein
VDESKEWLVRRANGVAFSPDTEAVALAQALISREAAELVATKLSAEDFLDRRNRRAFEVLCAVVGSGEVVDAIRLGAELDAAGVPDARLYVSGLVELGEGAWAVPRYIEILQSLSHKRRASQLLAPLEKYVTNGVGPDHLANVIEELQKIHRSATTTAGPLFAPADLADLLARDPEPIRFVHEPHLPDARRVWGFGAAESGKSMWAAWVACSLSRAGRRVIYVSQENPLDEELRRLRRLGCDPAHLVLLHDEGVDLAQPSHVSALTDMAQDAALVVIDTLTACWSGDDSDNPSIAALDRGALAPIVANTGATVLVLDHTGHPQQFVKRQGVTAGRGASSKGQKADVVLNFETTGEYEFSLKCSKMRGGRRPVPVQLAVIDTPDGGLDLATLELSADDKAAHLADVMVERISVAGSLTTNGLRAAVSAEAGTKLQTEAMRLLEAEDPPRVTTAAETVDTGQGRQRAKVWRPTRAEGHLDV